jgi:hypothetical protein
LLRVGPIGLTRVEPKPSLTEYPMPPELNTLGLLVGVSAGNHGVCSQPNSRISNSIAGKGSNPRASTWELYQNCSRRLDFGTPRCIS